MKKLLFIVVLSIFGVLPLSASLGPNVSKTADGIDLRWEEGSRDYFVMFKSLVEDRNGSTGSASNPQADSCLDYNTGSTFSLEQNHIPEDAYVEAAYLIWTAGADPSLFNGGLTDNSVRLSFDSKDGTVSLSEEITSSVQGTFQTPPSFEYEALKSNIATTGYFMYRVDVTDFMQEIIEKGREAGSAFDGYSLLGNYNVREMTCTNHNNYVSRSLVVGDWVLFFVYTSEKIQPKKIYVYNGLSEYQHMFEDINVTGFELPDEAELRITLVVHEGDPGNVSGTKNPESLSLSGAQTFDWVQLTNICNPPLVYSGMNYVEVYNSVSSMYGWKDTTPYCVGGIPPNYIKSELQYAIDVDTFVMSAKDPVYAPHLIKGDNNFWLKVSANQDVVYTNILILSIDTRAPKFDIPPNPETPDGREKNYCTCAYDADTICSDRPFYFTIKVENWGDNIANKVTVKDALPALVDYIAGTTEILRKKDGVTGKWEKVDDINGKFPFTEPVQIMDTMYYCDKLTMECIDSVTIRFKVKPVSYIQKHQVIENTAVISDETKIGYFSNSSVPLRLRQGDCPSLSECPEPPKELCGGEAGGECEKNEDCEDGYKCEDKKCVVDAGELTKDAVIVYEEGLNSPKSDESSIIITNPSSGLAVAQFTLKAQGDKSKSFKFQSVTFDISKTELTTSLSNAKLVHDTNGNGAFDEGEKVIAEMETAGHSNMEMVVVKDADRYFSAGTTHNFIVVLDASHPEAVSSNIRFNLKIAGPGSFIVSDAGNAVIQGDQIEFAEFRFEPENAFIVSRGANDPAVPASKDLNKTIPVLQIRTKSMQGDDTLKSVAVRTTNKSVKFGEGIGKGALYIDVDGDGAVSSADQLLGELNSAVNGYMTFDNLNLSYSKGEERHFLFVFDIRIKEGEMAQIQIPSTRLKLVESRDIVELPVTSKEFKHLGCEDDGCEKDDEEENGGCSCSVQSFPDSGMNGYLLMLSFLAVLIFLLKFKRS